MVNDLVGRNHEVFPTIASLVESFEDLHRALEGLLAVFELARLLDRSARETLLPDPQAPSPFYRYGAGADQGRCALPDCQRPLPPRSGRSRPSRYCSARCRELDHFRLRCLQVAASASERNIA